MVKPQVHDEEAPVTAWFEPFESSCPLNNAPTPVAKLGQRSPRFWQLVVQRCQGVQDDR